MSKKASAAAADEETGRRAHARPGGRRAPRAHRKGRRKPGARAQAGRRGRDSKAAAATSPQRIDTTALTVASHGAKRLPAVEVASYNLELRSKGEFLGDTANRKTFDDLLDHWRAVLREQGRDPFGKRPTRDISKKKLDALLTDGDPKVVGALQGAIEEFSGQLACIIRQYLKEKSWHATERVAIGGGFRDSRIGELVVGRTDVILNAEKLAIRLRPIRHDPDEAGLIGAVHLVPSWMFKGYDAILGVDIGGRHIRAGVVAFNLKRASDLSKAKVRKLALWRYDDDKPKRDDAVGELVKMLRKLDAWAKKKGLHLAPLIGVGCPGVIEESGSIARGVQNLPGNWATRSFHLPSAIRAGIPTIGKHETAVVVHNDAVVQGLSEVPFMQDVKRWGVLTIGTGLGNACFVNRGGEGD